MSEPAAEEQLLREREGEVLILTLNRPERMNALTPELVDELWNVFVGAESDEQTRAILITGSGRGFSSGADLLAKPIGARKILTQHYNPLIEAMRSTRVPIVAAINGVAAGAGASLAMAADLRVAAREARFIIAFTAMGLVPDAGATWLLPRLVGPTRAAEMALLAKPLDAETALAWGLVNRIAEEGEARAVGLELARELAAGSAAVGETKLALERALDVELGAQLAEEAELQERAAETEDFAEALRAFREKRKPRFKGR